MVVLVLPASRALRAVIGVDVGTQSARAGLFSLEGKMLRSASRKISTYRAGDLVEQSGEEIWQACCSCVQAVRGDEDILGLAFDATCSLAVVDENFQSLRVSTSDQRNVIVWMDHRATRQAAEITRRAPETVLRTVGGAVSPEMELPKIKWLYENVKDADWRPGQFFDLADYLSWRATGSLTRSLCTVVCKWAYQDGWDDDFLRSIGLSEARPLFGSDFAAPGDAVGPVSPQAAEELGLDTTTIVAAGAIDAHAGGLGCVGYPGEEHTFLDRLALVAGTSACHMASFTQPRYVPGVWGPYDSAMVPGAYLLEGGQSAAGALLDDLCRGFDFADLDAKLESMATNLTDVAYLTQHVHVDPDINGNRSPLADPRKTAAILGISSAQDALERTALVYLAACQALAYQTRQILETMGADVKIVVVCGGLAKNEYYLKMHADALDLPVALPREPEAVLAGSAVLAATAAGTYPDIPAAMAGMTGVDRLVLPTKDPKLRSYHDAKFEVFKAMARHALEYRATIDAALRPFES